MTHEQLKIIQMSVATLKPAIYNPRKISEQDFAQLVESIRLYEFVEPLEPISKIIPQ